MVDGAAEAGGSGGQVVKLALGLVELLAADVVGGPGVLELGSGEHEAKLAVGLKGRDGQRAGRGVDGARVAGEVGADGGQTRRGQVAGDRRALERGVERQPQRLHGGALIGLGGVQLEAELAQASAHQARVDHLQSRHLLGDEQH